ncbi:4703_t:CDS:1, partial [Entrophospora sp. SA101]
MYLGMTTRNNQQVTPTSSSSFPDKKLIYITSKYQLPAERLMIDNHLVEWRSDKRNSCVLC